MQQYWDIISEGHRQKLEALAGKMGVDHETAMRNIVNFLIKDDLDSNKPDYMKGLITAKKIEDMIDIITK